MAKRKKKKRQLDTITFGIHAGSLWRDLTDDYLRWIADNFMVEDKEHPFGMRARARALNELNHRRYRNNFTKGSLKPREATKLADNQTVRIRSKKPKSKLAKYYAAQKLDRNSDRYWKWRKRVFKRDKYTCQECGKSGKTDGVKIHAHHIKPWIEFPKLRFKDDNAKTLCEDCHILIHPWINPSRYSVLIDLKEKSSKEPFKTILRKKTLPIAV